MGRFPTLVRVPAKWHRKRLGNPFLQTLPCLGVAGTSDKSVEVAVWQLSVLAEHAYYNGRSLFSILIDIVKAYESIVHTLLWDSACALGFCKLLLRWLLCVYRMPRRLRFLEALSDAQ